jgi:hypothetical protein
MTTTGDAKLRNAQSLGWLRDPGETASYASLTVWRLAVIEEPGQNFVILRRLARCWAIAGEQRFC